MSSDKKLILIGDSSFAEVAYEYFTHDSDYEVVAFSVEQQFLKRQELFGVPIVPFETLEESHPPGEHHFYAPIVYSQLNRLRTRLYREAKAKGYAPASYISPRAFIWRNCQIGEHAFIFEGNAIQAFVSIGSNVVMWSGNHIGHHSTIGDNCFLSSHVVVSGHVTIGDNCFFGVNSTIADRVQIGADCLVGAASLIQQDLEADRIVRAGGGEVAKLSAKRFYRIRD